MLKCDLPSDYVFIHNIPENNEPIEFKKVQIENIISNESTILFSDDYNELKQKLNDLLE
jgi:hypothetical protein